MNGRRCIRKSASDFRTTCRDTLVSVMLSHGEHRPPADVDASADDEPYAELMEEAAELLREGSILQNSAV